ncbi:MAG: TonB-dependent copper receptor [Fluviicoccus sp.]|uniref:TonB-dependent copper receptor n=1 Tax=Fluviicoccus sp. TaxID=2003552 RepID=UPI002727ED17|nr:TonB-dependent copper receptor [Fluviicoccus sp.]MDO8331215.1 TonB-dependent copper receptor [Fluviicoccus sp.]
MTFHRNLLALSILTALSAAAHAGDEPTRLPTILVTAPGMDQPLQVHTDPRTPRQPLPAHDGADFLKTIPGFNVVRKSGTDGDATFRGLAGSRLGVLVDGENILGGCNARMDAPTAYIYPEIYNAITVIKGPQTVQHGPGNSAATILFERKVKAFSEPGYRGYASLLGGSAGRHDEILDAQFGNTLGYVQLTGSNSASGDYQDGDGNDVHSEFKRHSVNGALGWTPGKDSRLELSGAQSDGEAAYADRGMDGTKFLRNSASLRGEWKNLGPVDKLDILLYENSVDHIMDDQTLRKPGTMGYANPKRETRGGKIAGMFAVSWETTLTLGLDAQENDHSSRSAPASGVYKAWINDASFSQQGMFAEMEHALGERQRVLAGARFDQWEATDQRPMLMVMTMGGMAMNPNPTAGHTRDDNLSSGFLRYEQDLSGSPTTVFAGLSQSERFPDYWELVAKRGATSNSAFDTAAPEKTLQLDFGALYKSERTEYSASLFYNRIQDYLLVDYTFMGMDKMATGVTRNIDARSFGGELGAAREFGAWKADATLAYTRGDNTTDHTALAQVSPLEVRLGLNYAASNWSVGGLVRLVDDQSRVDIGRGNIVGKDLGKTPGFAVFSLNGNWKPWQDGTLSAGVDNLFDRTYAEAVSRAGGNGMGGAIPGYVQTTRVNEQGRTLWLKLSQSF